MNYNIKEIFEVLDRIGFKQYTCGFDYQVVEYDNIMLTKLPEGWDMKNGCTKCVIIPPGGYDYVVKIPFSCDSSEEDDDCEFHSALSPLTNEEGWDYCSVEADTYFLAKQEGIDMFFAETRYIGDYNNYPIYVQERCEGVHKEETDTVKSPATPDLKRRAEKLQDDLSSIYIFTRDFLAAALFVYGEELIKKLNNFIEEYAVGDLHTENYGYQYGTFVPIIYDYSGYHE